MIKLGYKLTDEHLGSNLMATVVGASRSRISRNKAFSLVQEMLDRGYDINQKDDSGNTPIFDAVTSRYDMNRDMINFLIKKGANINEVNKENMTPLACAVQLGDVEHAKLLISKGAKTNTQHKDGMTLMHYAVLSGNPEVVRLMAAKGLDVNAKDENGKTPLDYAVGTYGEGSDLGKNMFGALGKLNAKRGESHIPSIKSAEKDSDGLRGTLSAAQQIRYTEEKSKTIQPDIHSGRG